MSVIDPGLGDDLPEDSWVASAIKGKKSKTKVNQVIEDKMFEYFIKKQLPMVKWHYEAIDKVHQSGKCPTIVEGMICFCPECGPTTIPAKNLEKVIIDKDLDYYAPLPYISMKDKFEMGMVTTKQAIVKMTQITYHYRCDGCGLILIAQQTIQEDK